MSYATRKSINFTEEDVERIEAVAQDNQERAELSDLVGLRTGSFSEVVRALAKLGLQELERRRVTKLYKDAAEAASLLRSPQVAAGHREQTLRALDTMLPRADRATTEHVVPQK